MFNLPEDTGRHFSGQYAPASSASIVVACTCVVEIAVLWHNSPASQAVFSMAFSGDVRLRESKHQLVISSVMRKFFEITHIAFNCSDVPWSKASECTALRSGLCANEHGAFYSRGVTLRDGLAVRLWPDMAECSCPNDSVA